MLIGFIYGAFALPDGPVDFANIWDDPRGLTGSELSFACFAREMAKLGHECFIYMHGSKTLNWENVLVQPLTKFEEEAPGLDVAYSWNEPGVLASVPSDVLRMVNLQINSFTHCPPGFGNYVDLWTSPSDSHRMHVGAMSPNPAKWVTLPNGCDPDQYHDGPRIPGRVIWASSPDRGLDHLLEAWPAIKKAVPNASLRIFYKMKKWLDHFLNHPNPALHHTYPMQVNRAKRIKKSLDELKNSDVEVFESVSRSRMAEEMSISTVLAYPCDTVDYTEGFSVTLMEACASGTIPVTTNVDALGSIYGGSVPMVKSPVGSHLVEFTDLVTKTLTDEGFRSRVKPRARELAERHRWDVLAKRLERLIGDARHEISLP